jgi:uncharacterized protein YbjT (DUF2867 family)
MHITVIGASRGIGRATVARALAAGHSVRAVARSAGRLDEAPGLDRVEADATVPADMVRAVAGTDAVILTLGVPRDIRVLLPTTLFSDAARAVIPAMQAAGVRRLVAVTGFGAGDSAAALSSLERAQFTLLLGRAYADKAVEERLIRESGLDWTIARPGILTDNAASGRYEVLVRPETWRQGVISRADVADYLVRAVEEGLHLHETPALQRRG